MTITRVPQHTALVDGQFVTVQGPDGVTTSYAFDAQQRALYFKESQVVFPSFHGPSHILEDPVPQATCELPGLMNPDDKCKLDALLQTRVGVLGFQGAGMPTDGGWMTGEIILAAGSEFISLERIGNVVRFTVDSPIPLTAGCETSSQIFWVQDETDVVALRPPSCSGRLPGVNAYGELKVYLFPESTVADPDAVAATLGAKDSFPALIFKRYENSISPGTGQMEVVLKRSRFNTLQTEIGWSMTPGAGGVVENVFFTGLDADGNLTRFDMEMEPDALALGSLLYRGHLISRKMGVIVDYTSTVLSTNQYTVREWNLDAGRPVGDSFTARNVWQLQSPETSSAALLDSSIDLLPIGTLVELWWFKVGEVAGESIRRFYFAKRPSLNPNHIWTGVGAVEFGDLGQARSEEAGTVSGSVTESVERDFSFTQWGLSGRAQPLLSFDVARGSGTEAAQLAVSHRAVVDTDLPGLRVLPSDVAMSDFSERPVVLWNRSAVCNGFLRMDIGRPEQPLFVPYDILLRAPVDEFSAQYMQVVGAGALADGTQYVRVCGAPDLPRFGSVRVFLGATDPNVVLRYSSVLQFPQLGSSEVGAEQLCGSVALVLDEPFPGSVGDVLELLHTEYSSPILRVEMNRDPGLDVVSVQFRVGTLDMDLPYEDNVLSEVDDFVRGLAPGYTVSNIYSQAGTFTGVGSQPDSTPDAFVVYEGGRQIGGPEPEYWNKLEVMVREGQVWVWWNDLLIPPSPQLSASLPSPQTVNTPYFPISTGVRRFGKFGLRLWPHATVRRVELRTQISLMSEFAKGQLEIV